MKVTESSSLYDNLEKMSVLDLLQNINREDQKVPLAVGKIIPEISALVRQIVPRMEEGEGFFTSERGLQEDLGFWMLLSVHLPMVCRMIG